MSLTIAGKIAWLALAIGWYVLRYPFERRAKRAGIAVDQKKLPERIRLAVSLTGLGVLPMLYVVSGEPRFASYQPGWPAFTLGLVALAAALALFRLTHKALGRMWSVSLQLKQDHKLVTSGIYRRVRHPMYSAFWLMAAGAGAAAAQLDRRAGRPDRLRLSVLLAGGAGRATDGGGLRR